MSKPYVVGIDIGGTNTVFGIVDARGVVLASSSIKTRKHSTVEAYIDELNTEPPHRRRLRNTSCESTRPTDPRRLSKSPT